MVGARNFHKSAPFINKYPTAARDYRTLVKMAYEYLFTLQYVTDLSKKGAYNEEYELSLGVDRESIATKIRKEKREFGYYLKENAFILSIIGIVLVIGLGIYLYIYIENFRAAG